jgi:hypothetical protein
MPTRLTHKTILVSSPAASPAFQERSVQGQDIDGKGGSTSGAPRIAVPAKMQRAIAMHAAAARWRERRAQ